MLSCHQYYSIPFAFLVYYSADDSLPLDIYEVPELRSTTSRNATRTGSPLTSLLASTLMTGVSLPASTSVMGEWET